MTFDELLTKVRTKAESADVSASDFLAVQVNITGRLKRSYSKTFPSKEERLY